MLHTLKTPPGRIGLAALALLAFGSVSAQAQTGYAVTVDSLYSVNVATGVATLIGNDGQDLEGLAIAPDGSLFATNISGGLYSLNATTGAATFIGDTGRFDPEGLDFFGNTLVATDFNNPVTFFSINTATAATTDLITASTGRVRGMDSTGPNSALVFSDHPVMQSLQSVDLTTGTVTNIGTLSGTGASGTFSGLDFAGGNLYGVTTNGDFDQIDPLTGNTTLIHNNPNDLFLDFKVAAPAVPEASTTVSLGLLLALGLGGVMVAKKRKQSA